MKLEQEITETATGDDAETARVPRQERGRQRVASLLQAAADVFVEKGYDAATMTEIAGRANSSIGSLYQFFPTKSVLAEALRRDYGNALIKHLGRLEDADLDTPEALANRCIQDFLEFLDHHHALIVIAEAQPSPVHRLNTVQRMREQIAHVLMVKASGLTPERAHGASIVVQQMLRASFSVTQDTPEADRPAVLADLKAMLGAYLHGVMVPHG